MKNFNFRLLLAVVLISTLCAAWFAPSESDKDIALSERSKKLEALKSDGSKKRKNVDSTTSNRKLTSVMEIHARYEIDEEEATIFPAPPPIVPPPPPPPPPPPAPPQAPPLPFRVLGRYVDAGMDAVFLTHQGNTLVARKGDVIAGQYRVEGILGTSMSFTYIPLNQIQALEVGLIH